MCVFGFITTDSITFYQFCEILKDDKPMTKQALIKAFKKIDMNGDGFITHEELQKVLTMVRFSTWLLMISFKRRQPLCYFPIYLLRNFYKNLEG